MQKTKPLFDWIKKETIDYKEAEKLLASRGNKIRIILNPERLPWSALNSVSVYQYRVSLLPSDCKFGEPNIKTDEEGFKFVSFEIINKSDVEKAEEEAYLIEQQILQMEQACKNHLDSYAHWSSGPEIFDKAKNGKPKSKAIKEWVEECWNQYFTNKALIETTDAVFNQAMLFYPNAPYKLSEALEE